MKITADARRRHSDKTHTIYEGECQSLFRNGSFLLYGITEAINSSLNGTYTIQITLSPKELAVIQTAELTSLRSRIVSLEKKVETL